MEKIATKPKVFGIKDLYSNYVDTLLKNNPTFTTKTAFYVPKGIVYKEDGTKYIDYNTFKDITRLYYIKAGVNLINGQAFELGLALGNIFILRKGRNPLLKPRLNRGESFKLRKSMKAKGEEITKDNWKIFYVDEEYTTIAWHKPAGTKNIGFYKFSSANGQAGKGFKQIMSKSIFSNPRLLAFYPFVPYKKVA